MTVTTERTDLSALTNTELRKLIAETRDMLEAEYSIDLSVRLDVLIAENARRVTNERDSDWRDAELSGVDWREADLLDADLSNANLHRADLRGADLRHAKLIGADLREADLRNANLIDADLSDADVHRANFIGANLQS